MSTPAITVFMNENDQEIAVLLRHCDGYPDGHGKELAEFLSGIKCVAGYTPKQIGSNDVANGLECLAAFTVAHFKIEVGNFYLLPAGSRDVGEYYIYTVYSEKNDPTRVLLNVQDDTGKELFDGAPENFLLTLQKNGGNLE